jgi:hypothetical protein
MGTTVDGEAGSNALEAVGSRDGCSMSLSLLFSLSLLDEAHDDSLGSVFCRPVGMAVAGCGLRAVFEGSEWLLM